jgi:hypothetical protein
MQAASVAVGQKSGDSSEGELARSWACAVYWSTISPLGFLQTLTVLRAHLASTEGEPGTAALTFERPTSFLPQL